jgi:hypothetical protein
MSNRRKANKPRPLPSADELAPICDAVLALGTFAVYGELVLVADTLVIERAANGDNTPSTHTLRRDDGRVVHVFRRPSWRRP